MALSIAGCGKVHVHLSLVCLSAKIQIIACKGLLYVTYDSLKLGCLYLNKSLPQQGFHSGTTILQIGHADIQLSICGSRSECLQ